MSVSETERWIAEYDARQRAFREWVAKNQDTPIGRVAHILVAETGKSEDAPDYQDPAYLAGVWFALNAIQNEVQGQMRPAPSAEG